MSQGVPLRFRVPEADRIRLSKLALKRGASLLEAAEVGDFTARDLDRCLWRTLGQKP